MHHQGRHHISSSYRRLPHCVRVPGLAFFTWRVLPRSRILGLHNGTGLRRRQVLGLRHQRRASLHRVVLAPVERLDGRLLQLRPLDRSLEFVQLDGPAAVEVEGLEDGTQVVSGHVLEAKLFHAGCELDGIDRAAAIGVDLMEEVDDARVTILDRLAQLCGD